MATTGGRHLYGAFGLCIFRLLYEIPLYRIRMVSAASFSKASFICSKFGWSTDSIHSMIYSHNRVVVSTVHRIRRIRTPLLSRTNHGSNAKSSIHDVHLGLLDLCISNGGEPQSSQRAQHVVSKPQVASASFNSYLCTLILSPIRLLWLTNLL